MSILTPLISVVISFCLLGIMLYKRIRLGITLCVVPIVLALLTLDWSKIPWILYATVDPFRQDGLLSLLVTLASFSTSWLSYLYKETKMVLVLSEGLSALIKRQKITLILLPALIGLLSVPGGALLSAPIVESESKSLGLSADKMAYINLWFRHIIFPIYPLSQSLIVAAALTGIPLLTILLLQIPVIIVMLIAGYLIGLKRVSASERKNSVKNGSTLTLTFIASSLPISTAIALAIILGVMNNKLFQQGLNVVIASFAGLAVLALVSRTNFKTLTRPLLNSWIYDVTFATYGAFLLQNVTKTINIADAFRPLIQNGTLSAVWLLMMAPLFLSFLTGSPMGAMAIVISVFPGLFTFSPKSAALLYASTYLGYMIAPTHLCFVFTVDYFKTTLTKVYKYAISSFIITYSAVIFLYFLLW
ncbi:MAG: DUF401 family protein [Candidatus Bathyarchaeia archaeon]